MTESRRDVDCTEGRTGTWIPLMDYAIKKGISLSTLRRHIKANKLTHKVENGRYLLLDEETPSLTQSVNQPVNQVAVLQSDLNTLRQDLQRAYEEIVELKTLIAFYEEKTLQQRVDN